MAAVGEDISAGEIVGWGEVMGCVVGQKNGWDVGEDVGDMFCGGRVFSSIDNQAK